MIVFSQNLLNWFKKTSEFFLPQYPVASSPTNQSHVHEEVYLLVNFKLSRWFNYMPLVVKLEQTVISYYSVPAIHDLIDRYCSPPPHLQLSLFQAEEC